MALSGVAYLAQGWILGTSGCSAADTIPTLLGILLVLGWAGWLLVASLRRTAAHAEPGEVPAPS
jgi:hypothetical protein